MKDIIIKYNSEIEIATRGGVVLQFDNDYGVAVRNNSGQYSIEMLQFTEDGFSAVHNHIHHCDTLSRIEDVDVAIEFIEDIRNYSDEDELTAEEYIAEGEAVWGEITEDADIINIAKQLKIRGKITHLSTEIIDSMRNSKIKKAVMAGTVTDLVALKAALEDVYDNNVYWMGDNSDAMFMVDKETLNITNSINKEIDIKFAELYSVVLKGIGGR